GAGCSQSRWKGGLPYQGWAASMTARTTTAAGTRSRSGGTGLTTERTITPTMTRAASASGSGGLMIIFPVTAGWTSGPVTTSGTTISRGTAARTTVAATAENLRVPTGLTHGAAG